MSTKISSRLVSTTTLKGGVRCATQRVSGIDIFTSHMGIPIVQVYPKGLDVANLQRSLSVMLGKYPLLSGRMRKDVQGLPCIEGNDAGVRFKVHQCDGPLPAYGPSNHLHPLLKGFHTPIYPWNIFKDSQPLFEVDVYQFADGGAILSNTAAHSVMDGTAYWNFMVDWAACARGEEVPARSMEREQLIELGQANLEAPYTRGYVYEMGWRDRLRMYAGLGWQHLVSIDKDVFRIPAATIEQWKQQARAEFPDADGVTTAELVTAHCLKVLNPLWQHRRDRCLGHVIDLRYKRRLRVPRHFFGNALGHGEVMYSADELDKQSLAAIALKSRMPAESLTNEDLLGYLGLMERARQTKGILSLMMRSVGRTLDGGLVLNNCSNYPMYEIDFGTGRPSWHDATRVVFRMLMIISTPEMDGGVDIHLTALKPELEAMRRAQPR
jgi:shikimate O-hydroxycinnamoyltransferase